MAGSKNNTHYSAGYNLYPVTAADIVTLQLKSDATQTINVDGIPEGIYPANPGSIAQDRTGAAYLKVSGTGSVGWQQIATGTDVSQQFDGNSGSAVPIANILNVLGAGSLTTVASGNTVETQLTGLTNHAVLVGSGTSTITKVGPTATAGQVLQSAGAAADPAFSTATYPSTTTVSQLLYSSSNNVVAGLATANRAVVTTNATGVPVVTALATDGQLIIGSTAGAPAAATLTAGTGVSIANGSNTITISATGGGLTWSEQTSSPVSAAVNNGYVANLGSLLTFNLPGTFAVGDIIRIVGKGAGLWVIDAPAGDTIRFGNQATATGGTITATNAFDCIEIVGTVANDTWTVMSSVGNLTVA